MRVASGDLPQYYSLSIKLLVKSASSLTGPWLLSLLLGLTSQPFCGLKYLANKATNLVSTFFFLSWQSMQFRVSYAINFS